MAIIIFGTRGYGTVDSHEGEYAQTRFAHVYFVPLIPIEGIWIRGRGPDGPIGHAAALSGKSVLAAYLRVWGPVAALGALCSGVIPLMLGAVVPAALSAWSWRWHGLRGEAAQRRSDFNLAAFGTRCEPRLMEAPLRANLKLALDHEWNARKPNKSPNDVGAHGASDVGEAVIAYGLLRLAAVERGRAGAAEDASADLILAGSIGAPSVGDGPYRVAPVMPAEVAPAAPVEPAPVAPPVAPPRAYEVAAVERDRLYNWRLALLVLTVAGLGGLAIALSSLEPPLEPTVDELVAQDPIDSAYVRVTCDSLAPSWLGASHPHVALCYLGEDFIPVKLDRWSRQPDGGPVVVRGLREPLPDRADWVSTLLDADPEIQAHRIEGFIDAGNPGGGIAPLVPLVFTAAMPFGWAIFFRARRRQKERLAALPRIVVEPAPRPVVVQVPAAPVVVAPPVARVTPPKDAATREADQRHTQRVILMLLALMSAAGLACLYASTRPPAQPTRQQLFSANRADLGDVQITCDSVAPAWRLYRFGRPAGQIGFCRLGDASYPVEFADPARAESAGPVVVSGRQKPIDPSASWVRDGLYADDASPSGQRTAGYIDTTDRTNGFARVIAFLLTPAAPLGLCWIGVARWRRRRRPAAA